MSEPHPKFDMKYKMYVELYHKCGCPDRIVKADSPEHASQIAGRCVHGNEYVVLRQVF